ncbi:MAG: hypothetical protein U0599_02600 [Vicinamibacteria bacterium]
MAQQRSFDSVLVVASADPKFSRDMEVAFLDELRGRVAKVEAAHQIFKAYPREEEITKAAIDRGLSAVVLIEARAWDARKIARIGDGVGPGGVYEQKGSYVASLWDPRGVPSAAIWAAAINGDSGMLSGLTQTQEYRAICTKAARRTARELIATGALHR